MSNVYFIVTTLVACMFAVLVARISQHGHGPVARTSRYASLDGLRGIAAFLVFLHHAAGWRTFAAGGGWQFHPHVAGAVGPEAVVMFFMTTAFLFVDKVVFAVKPTDWLRLCVSRVLRMFPLFLLALLLVLIGVAAQGLVVREPRRELLQHIGQWLSLTSFGAPDINQVKGTWMMVAGATWTLPYEVLFYLALPVIAMLGGRTVPKGIALVASMVGIAFFVLCISPTADTYALERRLSPFIAGAAAAVLARSNRWTSYARSHGATWLACGCLVMAVVMPSNYNRLYTMLFPSVAFAIIVCGNSLFGMLTTAGARRLGDISYSVYLLHGLLLYLVLKELIGLDRVKAMSWLGYWGVVLGLIPLLLVVSMTTYRWIELPALAMTDRCTRRIRDGLRSMRSRPLPVPS